MKNSAIFRGLLVCLEFILIYHYTVDGLKRNIGPAQERHDPPEDKPTPPVLLLVYNCLSVPMRFKDWGFEGNAVFSGMNQSSIKPFSLRQVNISAHHPYQEIYGFIQLMATNNRSNFPVALYFSIPNEYSGLLPWYGIEIRSRNPQNLLNVARNSSKIHKIIDESKKFAYPEVLGTISIYTSGVILTAGMYRESRPQLDQVFVKFIVHRNLTTLKSAATIASVKQCINNVHTPNTSATVWSTMMKPKTTTKATTTTLIPTPRKTTLRPFSSTATITPKATTNITMLTTTTSLSTGSSTIPKISPATTTAPIPPTTPTTTTTRTTKTVPATTTTPTTIQTPTTTTTSATTTTVEVPITIKTSTTHTTTQMITIPSTTQTTTTSTIPETTTTPTITQTTTNPTATKTTTTPTTTLTTRPATTTLMLTPTTSPDLTILTTKTTTSTTPTALTTKATSASTVTTKTSVASTASTSAPWTTEDDYDFYGETVSWWNNQPNRIPKTTLVTTKVPITLTTTTTATTATTPRTTTTTTPTSITTPTEDDYEFYGETVSWW